MPTSGGGGGGSGGGLPQPGPLGYNIARRKPRQRWVGGFTGVSPGIPTTGISALIARVLTARPRGGRVGDPGRDAPRGQRQPSRSRRRRPFVPSGSRPALGAARRGLSALPPAALAATPIPSPGPLSWNPARRQAASDLARGVRGCRGGRSVRERSDDRGPTHHGRRPIAPMRPRLDAGAPRDRSHASCRRCARWRRGRDVAPEGPHSWACRPR